MGGNAFRTVLRRASFPRMRPDAYRSLKNRLSHRLQALYELVAVPPEAPGKADYGDLDIIVAYPREGLTHQDVKSVLYAACSIPPEGGRITNFAVPASAVEVLSDASQDLRAEEREQSTSDVYYQVDVTVLDDKDSFERTVFMTSYGDLGLILGHIAHSVGLSLGPTGLKLADTLPLNPAIYFTLSTSLPRIIAFLGLDYSRWEVGFATQGEIFAWVATSSLFDARAIAAHTAARETRDNSKERGRKVRAMFQAFLVHVTALAAHIPPLEPDALDEMRTQRRAEVRRAALEFFERDVTHAALLRARDVHRNVADIFNGTLVQEWTGLRGVPVKWLMDAVRVQLGARYVRAHPGEGWRDALIAVRLDGKEEEDEEGKLTRVTPWEMQLMKMTGEQVREDVLRVREDMDKAGKLVYDWKAAKAKKLASKKNGNTVPAQDVLTP